MTERENRACDWLKDRDLDIPVVDQRPAVWELFVQSGKATMWRSLKEDLLSKIFLSTFPFSKTLVILFFCVSFGFLSQKASRSLGENACSSESRRFQRQKEQFDVKNRDSKEISKTLQILTNLRQCRQP